MEQQNRRGSREFADVVPGRTTELYFDVTERRTDPTREDARLPALVMLQGDLPGQVFRLHEGRQLIGRRVDCEIRLLEKAVSGHHAEIIRTEAGVSVADLRSTNGTVVNGRRIRSAVFLTKGNLLKLGNSVFRYVDSLVEVEMIESLHQRATTDEATGVANRGRFVSRLAFLTDAASPARPVSVIVFDIDDFETVAHVRGRSAADALLQDIARIFRSSYEDSGRHFGRVGDESFALALADVPLATAGSAATTVRSAIEALGVTASIGVASSERRGVGAEDLLVAAEEAAAKSRREGGNRISLA